MVSQSGVANVRFRDRRWYLDFRWATREGLLHAWRRRRLQRRILQTPPVQTSVRGNVEVRALTWRRDCLDLIWALKSFYHFSETDYPLLIHDGGLLDFQVALLRRHFPDATIVGRAEADDRVDEILRARGLGRCREYRSLNITTRKLFDFFLLSSADYLISIDSDILFFRKPELLLVPRGGIGKNRYNRDQGSWYAMTPDEMEASFGIRPPEFINSGLSVIRKDTIDFDSIERWLEHPKLFQDRWVTEQTLHDLCAARCGAELLPDTYLVSTEPGLSVDTVCKHYPGFFRPLHYEEGMRRLVVMGFLDRLRRAEMSGATRRTEPVRSF